VLAAELNPCDGSDASVGATRITASQNNPAAKFRGEKPIGSWGGGMVTSEAIVGPQPRGLLWRLGAFRMMMAAIDGRAV
jgi:hypothetical protein